MLMQLDKWYFDCQTDQEFGYYYVCRLSIGKLVLISSEVHHFGKEKVVHWSRLGRAPASGLRELRGAGAEIRARSTCTELKLANGKESLNGSWRSTIHPLPRYRRPLYLDDNGWCDWKVWSPFSEVSLSISPDTTIRGSGYVDLVRINIPSWRIPFTSLHWGRLFSKEKWLILFHLLTPDMKTACSIDSSGTCSNVEIDINRRANGEIDTFRWSIDGRPLNAEVIRVLQRGPVLSGERFGRLIPARLLARLGSGGFEEKYWVNARLNGSDYSGPMEEVRWNER